MPAAQQRADRQRQKWLGRELRRLYVGVTAEPIPQDFLRLFEQIDRKQTSGADAP
jgi:hypothetical protein